MFLSTAHTKNNIPIEQSPIMKTVKTGLGITEASIIFSVSPLNVFQTGQSFVSTASNSSPREPKMRGDVFIVRAQCLDMALWKIGGAAVVLRLVQLANVSVSAM
jgi:hypothetical protein